MCCVTYSKLTALSCFLVMILRIMHVDSVWRLCCVCMSEQGFVAKRGMCLLTFCKLNHPLVMCVDSVWRLCRSGSGSTVLREGKFPACLCSLSTHNHPVAMCVDSVWRLCRSGWIFTAVGAEDAPARAWQSTVKTPSFLVGRMAV